MTEIVPTLTIPVLCTANLTRMLCFAAGSIAFPETAAHFPRT